MPLELAAGSSGVEDAAPEVAGPLGSEGRGMVDAGHLGAQLVELANARFRPASDVEDPAPHSRGTGEQRLDDVADKDEVASLVPVAEDLDFFACLQPVEEDRDDAALEEGLCRGP